MLGALGPTTRTLSLSPDVNDPSFRAVSFEAVRDAYAEQARGLVDGGVDALLVETIFDTLNAKAALIAIEAVCREKGIQLPVLMSVTITDKSGRTLSGQTVEAFWTSIAHAHPLLVGINCSLGAEEMRAYVEELAQVADTFVGCYPNAGLPNAFGGYDQSPAEMAKLLREFAAEGWVNLVGGCCGTTPDHIRAIADAVRELPPRSIPAIPKRPRFAGLEVLEIRPDSNFTMIGERTNVTGSKRFAKLVLAGDYGKALEVALDQVRGGANLLDVNMDEAMLDSERAMETFLKLVATEPEVARIPIMVDSSKWSVIEAGLKCVQGKAVVNSISMKEGEAEFLDKARLVRSYGAAAVVMAFDEQGQADTVERKVSICQRAYRLLTEQAGFAPTDIIFDPNIFAVATGIEEHNRYAIYFIEAVRQIKATCPGALISGGVSNLSFSFRGNDVVREAMHSAFLYHAIQAGMDMGIVNAGQLVVYEDIPKELLERVEDVLFDRRPDATERLVEIAEQVKGKWQEAGDRSLLARGERRAATHPRARARRRGLHRGGRGGSAPTGRAPAARDRRSADGRHEGRRRPLRRRQDVSAPGGEERARHEARGRRADALHGGREGAGPLGGQDRDGHRQGRRPRHRQEHRRRGARLQRLRDRRPRCDGAGRPHSRYRARGRRRSDRPLGTHHALTRRDGARRARNGTARHPQAAADRRRDHQPATHRGEDRARLRRDDGARARRVARSRRRVDAALGRAPRRLRGDQRRRAGAAARDLRGRRRAPAALLRRRPRAAARARLRPRVARETRLLSVVARWTGSISPGSSSASTGPSSSTPGS